jgi:putative lipoprotein
MRGLIGAFVAAALAACQPAEEPPNALQVGAAAAAATATITGQPWRLVAIRRPGAAEEPVGSEPPYTVEFGAGERYTGRAHCNSFSGAYEQPGSGALRIRAGAATLAACAQPSIADEYLRALASVSRYELAGDELLLQYAASGRLRFVREAQAAAAPEIGRTFVFDCDGGLSFTVRYGPGEAAVWAPAELGGAYQVLSLARSGSGARYEEGDTTFAATGDFATFELGGQRYVDCRSSPSKAPWFDARRRGATFRAIGNEPAWYVEIFPERLAVVTELGTNRVEMRHAGGVTENGRTTYRAAGEGHTATVVIDRRACADSMSGEGFEAAATVTLDERALQGCGRFL